MICFEAIFLKTVYDKDKFWASTCTWSLAVGAGRYKGPNMRSEPSFCEGIGHAVLQGSRDLAVLRD